MSTALTMPSLFTSPAQLPLPGQDPQLLRTIEMSTALTMPSSFTSPAQLPCPCAVEGEKPKAIANATTPERKTRNDFMFRYLKKLVMRERLKIWCGVFMVVVVPLETLFLMTSLMVCAKQLCHRRGQTHTTRNHTAQWGESRGESNVWVFRLSCGLRALPLSLPTDVAVEIRMSPAKHQSDRPQPRALKLRGVGGKGHDVLRGVGDLWDGHRRRRVSMSLSQEGVRPER
jgi:hypothetical protein